MICAMLARALSFNAATDRSGRSRASHRSRGQSLAEFALVVPVLLALIGAIVQFGFLLWAQNTLTQVVRDTGRWAATQTASPCSGGAAAVGTQANAVALNSSLLGYTTGQWGSPSVQATDALVRSYSTSEGVAVAWIEDVAGTPPGCPPKDNQGVYHVTIKISHTVPTFFPAMEYLPGIGTCDASGCHITLSSTVQFRMEPAP
jgi:Flp pilus assembly protein TadG